MSSITPSNINGNFPVYGQDNNTQGFRDNFTNIKSNFVFTKSEMEDIQNKAIFKSALTGTTLNNNMLGAVLENPQLKAWTESFTDLKQRSGDVEIDFSQGNFQKITTAGPINITKFTNWPSPSGSGVIGYTSLRLWIVVNNRFSDDLGRYVVDTVTFSEAVSDTDQTKRVSIGINDISGYVSSTNTLTFDVPGNYVFDISSADGGTTYLIFDNTRNRIRFRDSYFYYNPDVTGSNNSLLIGYGPALPLALAVESGGRDTISARGSFSSFESVAYHGNDIGLGDGISGNLNLAGYSVASSRSVIDNNGQLFNYALGSNDVIGYYNSIGATGNPANIGNVTTAEFGTIRFWTSSTLPEYLTSIPVPLFGNLQSYSPGGNIQFVTKQDYGTFGTTSWPRSDSKHPFGSMKTGGLLETAMSIENDQSVKFYGATVQEYQYINLAVNEPYYEVSPYTSTVIVDNDDGLNPGAAYATMPVTLVLSPAFTLRDGQILNISANCDIAAFSIVPYPEDVETLVTKQTYGAAGNGTYITYILDNSGGVFHSPDITGNGQIITGWIGPDPVHFSPNFIPSSFNTVATSDPIPVLLPNTIVASDAVSVTVLHSGAVGYAMYPGTVSTWTTLPGATSGTLMPTGFTISAGTFYKFLYRAATKNWHRIG